MELNSGDKALMRVVVVSSDSDDTIVYIRNCGNFIFPEKYKSEIFVPLKQSEKK